LETFTRRHLMQTAAAAAVLSQVACASSPSSTALPAGSAAALAPTGKLRACINLGNPILARKDANTGAVSGVSVDLATDLARQLGVPVELIVVDAALKSVQTVTGGGAAVIARLGASANAITAAGFAIAGLHVAAEARLDRACGAATIP